MATLMRLLLALLLTVSLPVLAAHRSSSAKAEFKHMQPCPATGKRSGSCPGYIIDHVVPLACGGADRPANMQWQTQADAKVKDRWERRTCGRSS